MVRHQQRVGGCAFSRVDNQHFTCAKPKLGESREERQFHIVELVRTGDVIFRHLVDDRGDVLGSEDDVHGTKHGYNGKAHYGSERYAEYFEELFHFTFL